MKDEFKTKAQLIGELAELRQQVGELEAEKANALSSTLQRTLLKNQVTKRIRDEIWKMKSHEDMGGVLSAMREGLVELSVSFRSCGVNLVDSKTKPSSVQGHSVIPQKGWDREKAETHGNRVVLQIWRAQKVAYRRDLGREDPYGEAELYQRGIRSVVDVPFTHGTLALSINEPDAFVPEDIEILQEIARVLSEGFARWEDFQALAQRNQEVEEKNRQLQLEVTERKQAEERLSQSEERYRAIVEDQTEYVARFLPDRSLTFVNSALSSV